MGWNKKTQKIKQADSNEMKNSLENFGVQLNNNLFLSGKFRSMIYYPAEL